MFHVVSFTPVHLRHRRVKPTNARSRRDDAGRYLVRAYDQSRELRGDGDANFRFGGK
jgi:hypothetical protein